MTIEKNPFEILESVKEILNQLPSIGYGPNAIQSMNSSKYGNGQSAYDQIMNEFNKIDLSDMKEFNDLNLKIDRQREELKELEAKHTNIIGVIGDSIGEKKGTVAFNILVNLKSEIDHLIERRDKLLQEIDIKENEYSQRGLKLREKEEAQNEEFKIKTAKLEETFKIREEELSANLKKISDETAAKITSTNLMANKKIKEAEDDATRKVKLINQFKDFLTETNDNMRLYSKVIIGLLVVAIAAVGFSIPNLLDIFESYSLFINSHSANITNWQIINYSIGLLIIKLPWALCVSAVLTGMYSLLKGLLITYEKINQDKRNMSAIYSISGNVAQSLNEYGIELSNEFEDDETGQQIITISVSQKELIKKKENFRWNQIMKYFDGMQNKVEYKELPQDDTKSKSLENIVIKLIDKFPK